MAGDNVVVARAARALVFACAGVGLDGTGATLLRGHSNVVFRLARSPVVARVSPVRITLQRAVNAVEITRWLTGLGFPAVQPLLDIEQPVVAADHVVTFWTYLPQPDTRPPVVELGRLLRDFHRLPPPPVALAATDPLRRVHQAVTADRSLPPGEHDFLLRRCEELQAAYRDLHFELPSGLIHGDAHRGNLLFDGGAVVLCDWDSVSVGPREWDLVPTHHGARFGIPADERHAFSAAYGYDLLRWPGFAVLRDLRDLFTLGAYIRNAGVNPAARRELDNRLSSIRDGDRSRRWYPL